MKKPSVIAIALMIILAVSGCGSIQQTAAEPGHAGLFASAADLAKLASVMLTGGYGKG